MKELSLSSSFLSRLLHRGLHHPHFPLQEAEEEEEDHLPLSTKEAKNKNRNRRKKSKETIVKKKKIAAVKDTTNGDILLPCTKRTKTIDFPRLSSSCTDGDTLHHSRLVRAETVKTKKDSISNSLHDSHNNSSNDDVIRSSLVDDFDWKLQRERIDNFKSTFERLDIQKVVGRNNNQDTVSLKGNLFQIKEEIELDVKVLSSLQQDLIQLEKVESLLTARKNSSCTSSHFKNKKVSVDIEERKAKKSLSLHEKAICPEKKKGYKKVLCKQTGKLDRGRLDNHNINYRQGGESVRKQVKGERKTTNRKISGSKEVKRKSKRKGKDDKMGKKKSGKEAKYVQSPCTLIVKDGEVGTDVLMTKELTSNSVNSMCKNFLSSMTIEETKQHPSSFTPKTKDANIQNKNVINNDSRSLLFSIDSYMSASDSTATASSSSGTFTFSSSSSSKTLSPSTGDDNIDDNLNESFSLYHKDKNIHLDDISGDPPNAKFSNILPLDTEIEDCTVGVIEEQQSEEYRKSKSTLPHEDKSSLKITYDMDAEGNKNESIKFSFPSEISENLIHSIDEMRQTNLTEKNDNLAVSDFEIESLLEKTKLDPYLGKQDENRNDNAAAIFIKNCCYSPKNIKEASSKTEESNVNYLEGESFYITKSKSNSFKPFTSFTMPSPLEASPRSDTSFTPPSTNCSYSTGISNLNVITNEKYDTFSHSMMLNCSSTTQETPRSMDLSVNENNILRLPNSNMMMNQQTSLHDFLLEVHRNPAHFKREINRRRNLETARLSNPAKTTSPSSHENLSIDYLHGSNLSTITTTTPRDKKSELSLLRTPTRKCLMDPQYKEKMPIYTTLSSSSFPSPYSIPMKSPSKIHNKSAFTNSTSLNHSQYYSREFTQDCDRISKNIDPAPHSENLTQWRQSKSNFAKNSHQQFLTKEEYYLQEIYLKNQQLQVEEQLLLHKTSRCPLKTN